MDMSTVPFDPTDVRARVNPPFVSDGPLKIDARQFVGHTIYLDPRRVMGMVGQPRTEFNNIEALAAEITTDGQKTAILVHPISHPDFDVELQAGERRTRSCVLAERMIRAEIRPVPVDRPQHYDDAFIENFNREDLTLLETVESVEKLLANGRSWQDIARMAGKTKAWVDQYTVLVKMNPAVRPLMKQQEAGRLNGVGRKLRRKSALPLSIWLQIAKKPQEQQFSFASRVIKSGVSIDAVRYLVQQDLAAQGQSMRQRSPSELFGVLERETQRMRRFYSRYLEMPGNSLKSMLDANEVSRRGELAGDMGELAFHLQGLSEAIGPVKKTKAATVSWSSHQGAPKQAFFSQLHPGLKRWVNQQLDAIKESGMSIAEFMDQQSLQHILSSGK